ncbi:glycoside hydrolase family 16 protein [Fulvivirga sp. M361]|nr:glycoside hydrolase family 16 protein [Fulvivirga sp. M361]
MHSYFLKLLTLVAFLTSCEEDTTVSNTVVLPSDLQVTIDQSPENPALLEVKANAEKANFFRFYFGEDDDFLEDVDGEITYTYKSSGQFTLTIQAHATSTDFISQTKQIEVPSPGPQDLIPSAGYSSPESYEGMTLVWRDEFNGSQLDEANWSYLQGDGCPDLCGWGNSELQYYTEDNVSMVEGNLIITAKEESLGGKEYTSSRLSTKNKRSIQYGRVDIRAALPKGQGLWPALWMLGTNIDEVGWPSCGEIDIMEMVGGNADGRDNTVHGTVHWFGDGTKADFGGSYSVDEGSFSEMYHVFSIIWEAQSIRWFVNDQEYHTIDTTPETLSEFQNEFYFLFNVAVGGNWPGSPDATTKFPQSMIVDYIRVFQPN